MSESLSLHQVLEKAAKQYPSKEALFDGYERKSYGTLYEESLCLASSLSQLGVTKGDRVMVCLPNWNETVVIYFSLAMLGAVLVPCNPRSSREEFIYILENSQASMAFLSDGFIHTEIVKHYVKGQSKNGTLEQVIKLRSQNNSYYSYEELIKKSDNPNIYNVEIDPVNDVFAILYTSGSTGQPKGVILTHQNVIYTANVTAEAMECTSNDVFLVSVPLFHVFGLIPNMITATTIAAKLVLQERFQAREALKLIEQEQVTVHHGVPTMFILELNDPLLGSFDLSTLRTGIVAAAPCPEEIIRKIQTLMGCNIIVSYGLTETSAGVTATSLGDDDLLRLTTVGKPLPGVEVKIVDLYRNEVARGETGELAVRSYGVMKGYFQLPETIMKIDEEGWFYTGDLAKMNDQNDITIVGRQEEMIIRGGDHIAPEEVENVFYKHPSVLEVAVVGIDDSKVGEMICAVIKLKPDRVEDEYSLKSYMEGKMVVPDQVVFREDLPKTANGKINKVQLKVELTKQLKEWEKKGTV
ncbi:class I adenylate-forming enzyme family protein [Halalkalibacter okhensis]|uniref:Long-chain acyl-CoA synthetase n=1 Tax=Halalkalibacter okhensis TaxID=333138 RepID=A0A0B0I7S0_9BACI|nr:class I adenylate-forming enzyme family protein [Halalkalibacter okhensis]KHF38513.1 long-chain acyl-CoA synthetase [Halalkalibacter okhensis]